MNKRYYATGGVRPELAKTILGNEGFKAEVYSDLGGTPTIGYGFTKYVLTGKDDIPSWKEYWNADGTSTGKTMSKEEADRLFEKIIKPYSDQVNNSLSSEIIDTLSQEQYDSLVDLTYRNGIGNMKDSGIFKAINDGNLSEASKIIVDSPDLNKIGGKQVNPGDAGYKGITARNLRASTPFSNLDSGVDPTVDNIAAALGEPTSEDIIASLPVPPESELQPPTSAGTEELYSNFLEEREDFQENYTIGQLKELDSEKVYDENIDDIYGMLYDIYADDNHQVRGEEPPSTFSSGTQERMDWLGERAPNLRRVIQPYGGEGQTFTVDREYIKDNIYTILDELGSVTDEDSPLSYKDRIYEDPYKNQQPETGIPESDFLDPRFLPAPPQQELQPPPPFSEDVDFPTRQPNMPEEDAIARDAAIQAERDDYTPMTQEEIDATIRDRALDEFIRKDIAPYSGETKRKAIPRMEFEERPEDPEDPVKRNMLSKLKGQDYMGMLSDIGGYAARMAPLGQALRDSNSYDRVRYPSISPSLPTAYTQKRDVGTAFNTARQAAKEQGKLDLGALSALATQQAQTIAGVEENVANARIGILNQAEQYNNQNAIRAMVDEAGNKGAAGTMKYQTLAAMSQMGQGSLREANMRRNDANVKNMFENVFGDEFGSYLKDKYSNA